MALRVSGSIFRTLKLVRRSGFSDFVPQNGSKLDQSSGLILSDSCVKRLEEINKSAKNPSHLRIIVSSEPGHEFSSQNHRK